MYTDDRYVTTSVLIEPELCFISISKERSIGATYHSVSRKSPAVLRSSQHCRRAELPRSLSWPLPQPGVLLPSSNLFVLHLASVQIELDIPHRARRTLARSRPSERWRSRLRCRLSGVVQVEFNVPSRARLARRAWAWSWRRAGRLWDRCGWRHRASAVAASRFRLICDALLPLVCALAGGRAGLLTSEELELRADGERAGTIVAEGLVERVLNALRFDLAEPREVLQLLGRRARYRRKALGTTRNSQIGDQSKRMVAIRTPKDVRRVSTSVLFTLLMFVSAVRSTDR